MYAKELYGKRIKTFTGKKNQLNTKETVMQKMRNKTNKKYYEAYRK